MLDDLSLTLKMLLQGAWRNGLSSALIAFDRPGEEFEPRQTTIDLYLYDIRENLELRSNEPVIARHNSQVTINRPPLRVACSYLVTAWQVGLVGDEAALLEHKLLSQVLQERGVAGGLLYLQRNYGNRYVDRFLHSVGIQAMIASKLS